MYDAFTDYVMFNPDTAGSIYVPLGKCVWTTAGAATYPSDDITPNSVTGPTDLDGSLDWPVWSETFINGMH